MITRIKNGKIISNNKITQNKFLYIKDKIILDITDKVLDFDVEIDAKNHYVSAGFIDIHTHGGGNCDFMDTTVEAFVTIAETHAKHGTTTIIPTTLSGRLEEMKQTFDIFKKVKTITHNGANMVGLHLEGPYFALSQKGAQDEKYIKKPCKEEYQEVLSWCQDILRWSAAPEIDEGFMFAKYLCEHNILPSIAHTDADYDMAIDAFKHGYTHITHLYSAMTSVHRKNAFRYGGVVEAGYLTKGMTVEIIGDGIHLPPPLLEMVYRFIGPDRTALITDSMRGATMGEGESILGSLKCGQKVIIEDGIAKLPDRSAFAGSVATMDRVVATMLKKTTATLCDVVKMATETPAKIMNLKNKGRLEKNADADIVIFDDDINIKYTIVEGKTVYHLDRGII